MLPHTRWVHASPHATPPVEQKQDDPVPVQVVAAGRGRDGCVCGVVSRLDWSVAATVAGSAIAGSAVVAVAAAGLVASYNIFGSPANRKEVTRLAPPEPVGSPLPSPWAQPPELVDSPLLSLWAQPP